MKDMGIAFLLLGIFAIPFILIGYTLHLAAQTKQETLKTIQALATLENKQPLEAFIKEFGEPGKEVKK